MKSSTSKLGLKYQINEQKYLTILADNLCNLLRNTFDSLALFVKHCILRVYNFQYLSTLPFGTSVYLHQQLANLAIEVPTKNSRYRNRL